MIEGLLSWVFGSWLGFGVSTTAVLLVLLALQGRRTLKYGGMVAGWYRTALVTLGAIGALLAAGVLTGIDVGRLLELVGVVGELLGDLVGALA